MTFSQVVLLLSKFGANLPAVLEFVERVYSAWQLLQAATGSPQPLRARTHTAEELAHCQKLAGFFHHGGSDAPATGGGADPVTPPAKPQFDGHRIAELVDWLIAHPAILNFIFSIFKIPVPPLPTA